MMKIIPLSEGSFTVDNTKHFVPFEESKDELQNRSKGSLLVEVQPFVVITSKDILLLDTGLGFSGSDGKMQIHSNLAKAGINPTDITKVLLSHLHKDHAGGVSLSTDHSKLSFPNAIYYVQGRELEAALKKGFPSFIPEELMALKNSGKVVLLKDNKGSIDQYIHYEVTAAHTQYHQVFRITDHDQTIFFGGDDAPQLQQMKNRFVAKYDFDGKKAMQLRQDWWERGSKEGWMFLFYHDVETPIYKRE